jgi:hypothetical protein
LSIGTIRMCPAAVRRDAYLGAGRGRAALPRTWNLAEEAEDPKRRSLGEIRQ